MTLDDLKRLLGLLTLNGVTYYKDASVELRLEPEQKQAPQPLPPAEPVVADQYVANLGPRARFPGSQ